MKLIRIIKCSGLSLLSLLVLFLGFGGILQAAELPKVIDKTNSKICSFRLYTGRLKEAPGLLRRER
ncbi:hypothetical protein [Desulfobacterium sp. N47]|uniref:hypothetical protein n=1 Tax=Desulfobacterium sp. N47 TaxID=3115210 RepID=UPI003CBA7859